MIKNCTKSFGHVVYSVIIFFNSHSCYLRLEELPLTHTVSRNAPHLQMSYYIEYDERHLLSKVYFGERVKCQCMLVFFSEKHLVR